MSQTRRIEALVELNNQWGPKTAHVVGDLQYLQKLIRTSLQHVCSIDTSRPPHIELINEGEGRLFDIAYKDLDGRVINVAAEENWIITSTAIMLKTNLTCFGKQTHFTILYSKDLQKLQRSQICQAIARAVTLLPFY